MTDRAEEIAREIVAEILKAFAIDDAHPQSIGLFECRIRDALRASEERARKAEGKFVEGYDLLAEAKTHWDAAEARVKELEARLEMNFCFDSDGNRVEVEPGSIPDGIFCRNETIRLQDENNDRLRARVKELEAALREIIGTLDDPTGGQHVADMHRASDRARAALGASHDD